MTFGSPPAGENENLYLYKWKKKSESTTTVGASETDFKFEAVASYSLINLTEINTTPTPDTFTENSFGHYKYYAVDTGEWVLKTGSLNAHDCSVYFRKNGIDYPVDGTTGITSVSEGDTNIEVVFTTAPTTDVADSIVLDYAYQDVTNPEPSQFCIKSFDPNYNGRDFTTTKCIGGKIHKKRESADLTEISITALKMGNSLSAIMLGERQVETINSKTVKTTTGNNHTVPWVIKIQVDDPDDSTKKLVQIYRDVGATSHGVTGGAENDYEETITFKCNPQDSIESEIDA